jgi:hypothetical protein
MKSHKVPKNEKEGGASVQWDKERMTADFLPEIIQSEDNATHL